MTTDISRPMLPTFIKDKEEFPSCLVHRRPMPRKNRTPERRILPPDVIGRDQVFLAEIVQHLLVEPVEDRRREFLGHREPGLIDLIILCIHRYIDRIVILMLIRPRFELPQTIPER